MLRLCRRREAASAAIQTSRLLSQRQSSDLRSISGRCISHPSFDSDSKDPGPTLEASSIQPCNLRAGGVATNSTPVGFDPYTYTDGRWLHRDALQRESRRIVFNFPALCERVISLCPGATEIVNCEKKDGGFNRVFLFTVDTGCRVVARLPTSIAGPPRLTTNSEVATMIYLQSKLSLPIPKVLDWSDNPANPIGTEYIIQEHAGGVQLHQIWPEMSSEQHMLCTKALSLAIKEMASLDFPAYGSLYFSDAPLEPDMKIPLEKGFWIGPRCSPVFWNRNPGELDLYGGLSSNCGPWRDLPSYNLGLIQTGYSRLPKSNSLNELPHQGSVQEHTRLLKISQKVLQQLIKDKRIQAAATPTLLHPDFHKRNIYVSAKDPTLITGLIDWQSTSIEPAFIYANETPDFATLPHEPEYDADDPASADKKRAFTDASICYQTYDVCMKGLVPKLRPARLLDPTLFRLFHYSHTAWRDSAAAIRQELIEISDRWHELGLEDSCPFLPTDEERTKHARDYEDFETIQSLKLWLKTSLHTNSDGWVPNDVWDAARDAHRAVYDEWIQTAREAESRGEDLTVAKADKLWPFDAR
ncbi:uncharacterized protein BO80DRAFT_415183 [Aspergillus ibericus CBS 121593]|uniref:Altered inheritance of mitochondria protein 9, mitochondrial n=1 Tax=Aspergillus ibericus CBS 121593 TaxID=1448316 RepID=A0A395GNZ8_9EURO|nr:hypothetical protein BO80DRAFT_415183 [Aspergillus ibericus CBS 121593]RAK97240.1 hypothetical protein BO80DRAFT_415183 [Aspergillus ibericus CBS 121593]